MSFEQRQALKLINNDRKERGLAPLRFNPYLAKLAENYAKDMVKRDFFSHVNPEGQSPFERMQEQKIVFNYAGENLAFNESVYAAQQAFMHSPDHKANILNANYTQVGIGIVEASRGRIFVVQEFIDG
ncbi:MAG: CAP domain-containing protein [Acidaminococcaceae bacterium]